MLERARVAGMPFAWITGDSVYGADHAVRRWVEKNRGGYVLALNLRTAAWAAAGDDLDQGAGQEALAAA